MTGNVVKIQGRDFISPEGYPTFGFWFDEKTKMYAIAKLSEKMDEVDFTNPFVDEVIYSHEPLGTWTANYVVVRIGNDYFLADNQGNCYHKADKPFIICANVFVGGDKMYIINKKLKRIVPDECTEFYINEAGTCNIALLKSIDGENQAVINSDGKIWSKKYEITGMLDASNIFERRMPVNARRTDDRQFTIFLSKDFDVNCITSSKDEVVGPRSKTYSWGENFYSMHFDSKVDFRKFGELEVITYKGKIYFFKSEEKIEEIAKVKIRDTGESLIYRYGESIITRNYDGEVRNESILNPKEVYDFMLTEELIAARNGK